MNSKSDEGVGRSIRSYADRVRADALEKAAELTGAVPPPWATGKPSMSSPLDFLPQPAPPAPPSPEPGAPRLASPPSLDAPAAVDTSAEVEAARLTTTPSAPEDEDRSEPGPRGSGRSITLISRDETSIEDAGTGDVETAVEDRAEAWLPPLLDIDLSLDDSTVPELEEIVENTRAELRQWKRELRQARRDMRRQRRHERRFGSE